MKVELYNGTICLDFNESQHRYTIDGNDIDGVTSVLNIINKPELNDWKVRTSLEYLVDEILKQRSLSKGELTNLSFKARVRGDVIANIASEQGTDIHQFIEDYIKGNQLPFDLESVEDTRLKSFKKFIDDWTPQFEECERVIYSKKYKYCGTLDFTARIDNKLYLGDFKSSKALRIHNNFQTAAYQYAYEEETGKKIDGRMIVRLDRSGIPEVVTTTDRKKDFDAFKSALILLRRINELKHEHSNKS